MNHASLFSGIGGAEVAASMMGWQNLFHCEIQEFPRKVLDYWFPNSESYEDITKTDFTKWHGKVDVLTGGFPCQPFSLAGRRKGADDNRYLWPQMLRAIRQIHPTWVVGENVAGIKTMVESRQVTQMGRTDYLFEENHLYREESRFTLDKICADLEAEGYSVQPIVIPACAIGAPHRRDRVWIIAHHSDPRAETVQQEGQDGICSASPSPHTQCDGHSPQGHGNQRARAKKSKKRKKDHSLGLEDMAVAKLLPTPCSIEATKFTKTINPNSQIGQGLTALAVNGLLPTPTAMEVKHSNRVKGLKEQGVKGMYSRKNGALRPNGLTDFLDFNGMMPTPSARDWKGCTNPGVKKVNGNVYGETLPDTVKKVTGSTSQLNPLFVEEMMGFPLMWTALPFLSPSGDKNP
jgi:DNA-cytosine methyltransferase